MVLVDTSVWVAHLRQGDAVLEKLLTDNEVICHKFIIGELACGNIKNRVELLSLLNSLPKATKAKHDEVMSLIENYRLMGLGLGYIDMHLIASILLTKVPIWTFDKKLNAIASKLKLAF